MHAVWSRRPRGGGEAYSRVGIVSHRSSSFQSMWRHGVVVPPSTREVVPHPHHCPEYPPQGFPPYVTGVADWTTPTSFLLSCSFLLLHPPPPPPQKATCRSCRPCRRRLLHRVAPFRSSRGMGVVASPVAHEGEGSERFDDRLGYWVGAVRQPCETTVWCPPKPSLAVAGLSHADDPAAPHVVALGG